MKTINYHDVTKRDNTHIITNLSSISRSEVLGIIIQTDRIESLERDYSNYGSRQLYYKVVKPLKDKVSCVIISKTLYGLQSAIAGKIMIENMKETDSEKIAEDIINSNAETISLDLYRNSKRVHKLAKKSKGSEFRLRDYWPKPVAGQDNSNSYRIQLVDLGTGYKVCYEGGNEDLTGAAREPIIDQETLLKCLGTRCPFNGFKKLGPDNRWYYWHFTSPDKSAGVWLSKEEFDLNNS